MKHQKSVGCALFREGEERKYLLLRYGYGHWGFVKGKVEEGENEKETILREIREETGIEEVDFVEGFRERISYYFKRGDKQIHKEVVFYLARTNEEKVTLSREHKDYSWLKYEKAIDRLSYENTQDILKKSKKFLEREGNQKKLSEMREEIKSCTKCPLSQSRSNAVPGKGPVNAKVMIVGGSPGTKEDKSGDPFVGKSGKTLKKLFEKLDIEKEKIFFTNLVKCKPPGNREINRNEAKKCIEEYLKEQIEVIDPDLIVTLGLLPLKHLLYKTRLKSVHGKKIEREGRTYFPTYDPGSRRKSEDMKKEMNKDLRKLKKVIKNIN